MEEKKQTPAWLVKLEMKAKKAAKKAKEIGQDIFVWGMNNKATVAAAGAVLVKGASIAYKEKKKHDERRQIECRVYDRRSDTYWWTKRPLKPSEKLELEQRSRNGELKSEVLREKGLLKY